MSAHIRNFAQDFQKRVETQPNETAVIVADSLNSQSLNYQELNSLIERCLTLFQNQGLKPNDNIVAILPNGIEMFALFLAALRGGFGFAPYPCTATAREMDKWIKLVSPKLVVYSALTSDELQSTLSTNPANKLLIPIHSEFSWLPKASVEVSLTTNEPKIYISTSGTTGEPKAIVVDGNRLWASGCAFLKYHGLLSSKPRFLNILPMSYLGGLFNLGLIPLAAGGSVVIEETFSGQTILKFWQTVSRYEVNALWLVPTIARALIKMGEKAWRKNGATPVNSGIQTCFIGTAPIRAAEKQRFSELFGVRPLENFALSETTFFTSENQSTAYKEGAVGEVLPYADVKFRDLSPDEQTDSQGGKTPKEILVKSPFMFLGYLQDGTLNLPLDSEGYLATGDLGLLDDEGNLIVQGRIKDAIKKGGYFISLREVEVLAEENDLVQEAAAVAIPHSFYGESYNLYVIPREGLDESSINQIRLSIHGSLMKHKWPEEIRQVASLPKTASGKVIKRKLLESL